MIVDYAKWLIKKKIILWIIAFLFSTTGLILIAIIAVMILVLGLIAVIGGEEGQTQQNNQMNSYSMAEIPEGVLRHEDAIREEMEAQGLDESFLNVLMAMASQESGGTVPDIFQSSESLGLPPNSIGTEQSIEQGVKYFKQLVDQVGVENAQDEDLNIVLQAYNFGEGFIAYAQENGGYSQENAQAFSDQMAEQMGWGKYGDVNYVSNVTKYIGGTATGEIEGEIIGDMALPVSRDDFVNNMTCGIGCYYDSGSNTPHPGYDFGVSRGTPVYSMVDGTVIEVAEGSQDNPQGIPLATALTMEVGNYVRIIPDNQTNVVISYMHLTGADNGVMVEEGMKVKKGQTIGHSGNSGRTTGDHLHLDMLIGGRYHADSAVRFYEDMLQEMN